MAGLDLIALPLLLIYRKQYGRRMTLRMLAVFWMVMSAAGLITEEMFKALGWVPTTRPTVIAGDTLGFNYTTVLDLIALVAFAALYWLYRNRERFGGGAGYAKDPSAACKSKAETLLPRPRSTGNACTSALSTAGTVSP